MVKYWLLTYPRGNLEITLAKGLIGGKSTEAYKRLFKEQLSVGDFLVLYVVGEGKIKSFCKLSGKYKFDESEVWPISDDENYPHRLPIEIIKAYDKAQEPDMSDFYDTLDMLEEARAKNLNLGSTFGLLIKGITPKEISEHDFKVLSEGRAPTAPPEAESGESIYALSVEKDLESYLIENLDKLEPGLKPYKSTDEARQYRTDVGNIDIMAMDKNSRVVVIELKAGEADRQTLGQIIPYISWVKKNESAGKEVRGIIVASSFDYRVIQALDVLPFLSLFRYKVDFKFEKAV